MPTLKILITGPESSGKTRLAEALARHFRAPWVPEFARTFLNDLDREYREEDLLQILDGQLRLQQQHDDAALVFCDTGPEVIHVWSEVKFGHVDDHIQEMLKKYTYDLTLLCRPDLPWEPDPLREAPESAQREVLFVRYQELLEAYDRTYTVITGKGDTRTKKAVSAVQERLNI